MRRKHRIVGGAELDRDIVELLALDPIAERVAGVRHDVLGQDPPFRADQRRQADGIIAFARADIGDPHAGLDPGQRHDRFGLAQPVARILGRESVVDDRSDRALGRGKVRLGGCARQAASSAQAAAQRRAALLHIFDLDRLASDPLRQSGGHESIEIAIEHVGRAVEVMPVRKSLTS